MVRWTTQDGGQEWTQVRANGTAEVPRELMPHAEQLGCILQKVFEETLREYLNSSCHLYERNICELIS